MLVLWPPPRDLHGGSDECKRHNTGDWSKVSTVHRDWWRTYTREHNALHAQELGANRNAIKQREKEISELSSRLAEMTAVTVKQYHDAPLGDLQTWVRSEVVKSIELQRQGAYAARDRTFVALWRIDVLHNDESDSGACSCEKNATACKELAAIKPVINVLDNWETAQIERLEKGLEHGLPRDHPEVMRRSGGWR